MVRLLAGLVMIAACCSTHASESEYFGDWEVAALHDEMDTVTRVSLMTRFVSDKNPANDRLGFTIFGGSVITLNTSVGFIGDPYWPSCDFELGSISVNGKKAVLLTALDEPGECSHVEKNGTVIKQLKSGGSARVRLGLNNGTISLNGFDKAWARALRLSKR